MTLWIVEGNARAQSLYERRGFYADGARYLDEERGVPDISMTLEPLA